MGRGVVAAAAVAVVETTTKALAAADAVLGRNSRDFALAGLNPNPRVGSDGDALLKVLDADPYTYRSAESYSRVYHHR